MSKILAQSRNTGQLGTASRGAAPYILMAVVVLLVLTTGITSCEDEGFGIVGDNVCLTCHNGQLAHDVSDFSGSVHGNFGVGCEDCHGPGLNHVRNGGRYGLFIENPAGAGFAESYDACARCHAATIAQFESSVHFSGQSANCFDCHNIHKNPPYNAEFIDNTMCLNCHAELGFATIEALDLHIGPFHRADPTGTGLGRCTLCHMVPLTLDMQEFALHGHSFHPVPPIETLEAAGRGVDPLSPNTCAGIAGCHDANVPGSGFPRDINNLDLMEALQNAYTLVGGLDE